MSDLKEWLDRYGIDFTIYRDNQEVASAIGMKDKEKVSDIPYIGFLTNTDIQPLDILKNEFHESFVVTDTSLHLIKDKPYQLKVYYEPEEIYKQKESASTIYNVQNAYGSVFGSQSVVNLNYENTITELREQIESSNSVDKEELKKVTELLEMVINNQVPASKGLFSKFSNVLKQNPWFTNPMMNALFGWLTSQLSS